MEKFTFFWGGPFSQWAKSPFQINGLEFNCAEQWMMYAKARIFGDLKIADEILKTSDPQEQKALGRKIANFNPNKWNEVAKDVVYVGSYAKYSQNKDFKNVLLATVGTTLVEASTYDTIWGIGLAENDPLALSKDTWKGTNWLGYILTELRDEFIQDHPNLDDCHHDLVISILGRL